MVEAGKEEVKKDGDEMVDTDEKNEMKGTENKDERMIVVLTNNSRPAKGQSSSDTRYPTPTRGLLFGNDQDHQP
jgi:hypothetical protein